MLQVNRIREEWDQVVEGLKKRNLKEVESTLSEIVKLDQARRETQKEQDEKLSEANRLAREIGLLMKEGKKEDAEQRKLKSSELKSTATALGKSLTQIEENLQVLLYSLPNVPHPEVPPGKGSEQNVVVHQRGQLPKLSPEALPHWELIEKFDIIDFPLGNKISGAGFPVYKGKGARLQRALINFFLDEAEKAGYEEIQAPILVNEASGYGTGQLPDKEGQMYRVTEENLFLIPTAEVPITNLFRDMILPSESLPVRKVGYTPCFRREAGSWGAHVRGLNRLHQFDKVEIVQISLPELSYALHEKMTEYVESLLDKLELPYRRLLLCGGDIGFNAAKCYDLEVFSGAQGKWLEVSSISNFETFQANRLKLRYKNAEGKTTLLHTLNGSALALPRIVAALLENNQEGEGIHIPKVLVPYTGFDRIS